MVDLTLWASSRSSIAPGSQVPMWGARGGGYPGGISWMHRRREPVWDGFFGHKWGVLVCGADTRRLWEGIDPGQKEPECKSFVRI